MDRGPPFTLWSAAVKRSLYPHIDQQIKARLTESQAWRYEREHARPVLRQKLRAQLAGHDINSIIDQITARRWTALGPFPASCTAASSSFSCPTAAMT